MLCKLESSEVVILDKEDIAEEELMNACANPYPIGKSESLGIEGLDWSPFCEEKSRKAPQRLF